MDEDPGRRSGGPAARKAWAAMAVVALALAALVLVVANVAGDDGGEVDLVIPSGAAAAVDRGEVVDGIPDVVELSVGDALVVENRDSRPHTVGPVGVGPGEEERVTFDTEGRVNLTVTFHPRGTLTVVVD